MALDGDSDRTLTEISGDEEGRESDSLAAGVSSSDSCALTVPEMQRGRAIIEADGVSKYFGDQAAVLDVSFTVPEGAIFGYVGPSGSGKTTTIRMLLGVYSPSEGRILVLGMPPDRFSTRMRERVGYMPQHFVLYPDLTVWENLNFAASIYGLGYLRRKRLKEVLDLVELGDHKGKLARQISGGMQRRLTLATTLVHDPDLVFLDEPTAGIDPVLRAKFWHHFREMQCEGRTIFVTTQYVAETEYCDLVGVMVEGGRLLAVDTPDGLRRRAYGGDLVDVTTTERMSGSILDELGDLPFVRRGVQRTPGNGLRIVVDDSGTAIPEMVEWARNRGIAFQSIEPRVLPFDDVFVELMRQREG